MPTRALLLSVLSGFAVWASQGHAAPADDCRSNSLGAVARIISCGVAIEAGTDPGEKADLLIERAEARRPSSEGDAILADLAAAERLVLSPDPQMRARILVERGEVFRARDDLDAALADALEASELDPASAEPLVNHGLILHDQGDHEGAVEQLALAMQVEPQNERALLISMYVLADAGRIGECLKFGDKAVQRIPARAHTWAYRGRCLADLGRPDEALFDYQNAAEIGLQEAWLYDNIAIAYINLNQPQNAVEPARRAVTLDPASESAQMSLATALVEAGDIKEGIAAYRAARAAGVEDKTGFANAVAWSLYRGGHYAEALPIMEEWLTANPVPSDDQYYELDTTAHILAAIGRTYDAVQMFLRAAEIAGEEQRAYYEARLTDLGFPPEPGDEGLRIAFQACFDSGQDCILAE